MNVEDWRKNELMVTPRMVEEAVAEIAALAVGDDEAAHSAEDTLHREVLQAIADHRVHHAPSIAAVALRTTKLDFWRWCA